METTREKGPLAVARSSRAREQVLSRWQGTLGELRELAGMPELARYEYRRELERLSAAVGEEPRRSCAVM